MSIYTNQFYVYIYLREDGTPYYIGKGKHNRAWSNTGRAYKAPNDPERIIIHTDNLTEEQAFSLEMDLIAHYGRKDNGTGILRNLTDGGEGMSGHVPTEEHRRKIAEANTGKAPSDATKKKISQSLKGQSLTEEHRRKIAEAHTGKVHSDATKKKISESHRRRPCRDGLGVEYESIKEAAEAHGIKYQTARNRCRRSLKGWSYI